MAWRRDRARDAEPRQLSGETCHIHLGSSDLIGEVGEWDMQDVDRAPGALSTRSRSFQRSVRGIIGRNSLSLFHWFGSLVKLGSSLPIRDKRLRTGVGRQVGHRGGRGAPADSRVTSLNCLEVRSTCCLFLEN